jgi:hypothetical protein
MAAEGKQLGTQDGWFEVKQADCCLPKGLVIPDSTKEEREAQGFEIPMKCGKCLKHNVRVVRVVTHAEMHDGAKLDAPVAEVVCPGCGNQTSYMASFIEEQVYRTTGEMVRLDGTDT